MSASVALFGVRHAQARPLVERALAREHRIDHRLHRIAQHRGSKIERLSARIVRLRHEAHALGSARMMGRARFNGAQHSLQRAIRRTRVRLHRHGRAVRQRVMLLEEERRQVGEWLSTWGVFRACPVDGPNTPADNFGIVVRLPGVPVHRHEGDDIGAATGTPIVAPFEGYAFPSRSELGGLEVTVLGARGFVYNAHLSAYGTLGSVRTGDVIGYVGSTGDATGPHDHFEWHPDGGTAVDPNPYLLVSC